MFPYHYWVMIWICKPAILLLRLKVPTGGRVLFNIVTTFAHFFGEINSIFLNLVPVFMYVDGPRNYKAICRKQKLKISSFYNEHSLLK